MTPEVALRVYAMRRQMPQDPTRPIPFLVAHDGFAAVGPGYCASCGDVLPLMEKSKALMPSTRCAACGEAARIVVMAG